MNSLEKKSFYSFLGLYIVSSLLFILLVGYWYYTAQKNALENETYYTLQHIADMKAGSIIMSHMSDTPMKPIKIPKDITLALINTKKEVVEGKLIDSTMKLEEGYRKMNDFMVLISDAPQKHLNIAYVVVQTHSLYEKLKTLRHTIFKVMLVVFIVMIIIAWMLSKFFMKPVHQKVVEIERFINDVTHELNTPITSLSMATNQALKEKNCTQKTLKNISISTKQLYDIYSTLTYLNFSQKKEQGEVVDIAKILQESIVYYSPLCESKHIDVETEVQKHLFTIPKPQLKLLFGNLIGNAIKYSPAHSTLIITLKEGIFCIKDEGIGIATEKQKEIFKKFKRATEYSGGFGVGLNIVKSICDTYGIDLSLHSTLDVGTEFKLSFYKQD
ncbi:MAG: sensor histidine kinase [Sulfurovum sp.]|nr:MAG: sensor histidine kinase [Sulfurovum sp.]